MPTKMKKFKDFVKEREYKTADGETEKVDWTIDDIFEMLDYLSEEIENIKNEKRI